MDARKERTEDRVYTLTKESREQIHRSKTRITASSEEWQRSPHKAKVNSSASPSITEQLRGGGGGGGGVTDHFQPYI